MDSPSKQRRYPRVGMQGGMHVAWQGKGEQVVSRITTAGLGGLFIRVKEPPPVGDIIRLYFEIPGGQVRARAVIRSSIPGKGMGIEFTSMGAEARGRLTLLLRHLLEASDPTEVPESLQT